jgi:hypothetical protein
VGLVEEVRFLTDRTIYSTIGDVVAYMAMALVVLALVFIRGVRTRSVRLQADYS